MSKEVFQELKKIESAFLQFRKEVEVLKSGKGVALKPQTATENSTPQDQTPNEDFQKIQGIWQFKNFSEKVKEMDTYLGEYKKFNDKFHQFINESNKDLWTEISTIKNLCKNFYFYF